MNIALISPIMFDLGAYTIAPQLKANGHNVRLLFILELMNTCYAPARLSKRAISHIATFLKSSDLIGINCLSENYHKTAIFIDSIRAMINKPVIWGGIHATLNPEDCIKHVDIVCVGEGEEAIVDLAGRMEKNEELNSIQNLIFKPDDAGAADIQLRPPVDLNSLKPFDYDLESQFVVEKDLIRNVEERDFKGNFLTYSSRGCPFKCSYCCNSTMLGKTYIGQKYCRQRDVEPVVEELKVIKNKFPSCKAIWFNEADFLHGKDHKIIEEFSKKYKAEIGIPFYMWTNPASIKEESIRSLVGAGFKGVNIGTVNANPEIQESIYNRTATPELYKRASAILRDNGVSVEYDFILCNPYESNAHILNNINLLRDLPPPFKTVIYSLTYFPETELYRRAVADGIIKDRGPVSSYIEAAYKTWIFNYETVYLNIVASLLRGRARKVRFIGKVYGLLPDSVLGILISKPFVKFFSLKIFRFTVYPLFGISIKMGFASIKKISKFQQNR
ncbi:MAG: cobalamin B12-binding domain-containing protein [Candidatus Omnitrophica bacterium]|nr:cobalamin B12-binding domain-containing protein [Candidatus Omnitrophota bacterium]